MKKTHRFALFLLTFLFVNSGHSALAPYYHSIKEMSDLFESIELVSVLGVGRQIHQIKRKNNKIIIISENCQLDIKSTITNINKPEAPIFKFEFGNLICK